MSLSKATLLSIGVAILVICGLIWRSCLLSNAIPIGLWVVPSSEVQRVNQAQRQTRDDIIVLPPGAFYFDGGTVTLFMLDRNGLLGDNSDGYVRLRAKMVGGDLFWLPPFRDWEKLATLNEYGRFVKYQSGFTWEYSLRDSSRRDPTYHALVKARPVFDPTSKKE